MVAQTFAQTSGGCARIAHTARRLLSMLGGAMFVVLAALIVQACTTVPETGRRQLLLLSPQQEVELGLQAFTQIKDETPISSDRQARALVDRVGQRIAAAVDLEEARWEFVLFDSETPNAFALPGGKVGIYTGILDITQTEAGLATVMGHEVAHVVARHGAERMSESLLLAGLTAGLEQLMANRSQEVRSLAVGAFAIGGQLGRSLPHSRLQELEADELGLFYMARAGYDPTAAVDFWKRFRDYKGDGNQVPEFLSTHPVDDRRIAQIEALLPEALAEYREVALAGAR